LLPNGKVLVAGGADDGGFVLSSAELYDATTGEWTTTGSLVNARSGHTATLLQSGKVLVAGGDGSNGLIPSAELYDPAKETWTLTGPMATARGGHTATLLPNGQVLVAGGFGVPFLGSSAELYNPDGGAWIPASGMNAVHGEGHTAVLLQSGKVLVAGGGVSSAELYNPGGVNGAIAQPTLLANAKISANGALQFGFTNTPGATFSVLATGFPMLPWSDWMVLGGVVEISPGQFQFTDPQATNYTQRFYRLRSP
jgi:hypothetical protein